MIFLHMTLTASAGEKGKLPLFSYRALFQSLIKRSIQAYSPELFEVYFGSEVKPKPYTFSILFDKPRFQLDTIEFERAFFRFSTSDPQFLVALYNQIVRDREVRWRNISLTVQDYRIERVPLITESEVRMKTFSPILVRHRDNERYYLIPPACKGAKRCQETHEDFIEALRFNVEQYVSVLRPELKPFVNELYLIPEKCEFVCVKYEKNGNLLKFPAFKGIFMLRGAPDLLNFLVQVGMGSRRSMGFGMIGKVE